MTATPSPEELAAWLSSEAVLSDDAARHYEHEGEAHLCDPHRQQSERFRAAAALIRDLEARETWQPIETAPKDGSLFLAVWSGETRLTRFSNSISGSHHFSHSDGFEFAWLSDDPMPTHWRPLPAPPVEAK